jgi:hypothetical protein
MAPIGGFLTYPAQLNTVFYFAAHPKGCRKAPDAAILRETPSFVERLTV